MSFILIECSSVTEAWVFVSLRTRKTAGFLEESGNCLVSGSDFLEQRSPLSLQPVVLSPPIWGWLCKKFAEESFQAVTGCREQTDGGQGDWTNILKVLRVRLMQPKSPAETNHVQA